MEIPDGKYRGRARAGHWPIIESSKGTPGIGVEIDFSGGDVQGATLTWTGWLSDGALDRTVESLRAMGWQGLDLDDVSGLEANEVEVVVQGEEYEGKWYPRISFINRIGGALGAKMTQEKARTFAAAMRSRIQALDAAKGTKAAAPKATAIKPAPLPAPQRGGPPEPPPHTDADAFDVPF